MIQAQFTTPLPVSVPINDETTTTEVTSKFVRRHEPVMAAVARRNTDSVRSSGSVQMQYERQCIKGFVRIKEILSLPIHKSLALPNTDVTSGGHRVCLSVV